jgi:predicted metal-dependent HD superfamily phosphohydrolase
VVSAGFCQQATLAAWQRHWRELGAVADDALHARLIAAWSEPQRQYHTLQHLDECLAHVDTARATAQHPGEIALALWFHDAVYDTQRHDNEARSAHWAHESLLQAGVARDAADRVHALVMATRHDALPQGADAQLLVDIDLAILGAPRERFDEYERQVGLEYAHVPQAERRAGRSRILRAFLARPAIYSTPLFRARFEAAARENLAYSLRKLG